MPLFAPEVPVATVNPFMAQVLIDPTVVGRNGNLVVFRRKPKRLSVRRQLNDGPVLQSFAQWETIVGSVIQAAGSVGSAAVSAALAPRYQPTQAPPPVQQPTTLLAPQAPPVQAPAQTQVNQSIAGQETTPAHYQVPAASPSGFNLANLESNPTLLIAGGAAFILLLVLLMKK